MSRGEPVRAAVEVAAPLDDVWAWHERRGAIVRLLAPWLPLRVVQEATSLRDGTAVLALPGGLRWRARHDPAAFEAGRRFVDELVTPGLRRVVPWRHTHTFEALADGGTRVTDEVRARVPQRTLTASLAYRGRQLAGDLAAHAWARTLQPAPLTVAVTGASGLVGTALCAFLATGGHHVVRLVRRPASGPDERQWAPLQPAPDLLDGIDAVVHLAGEPIAGRFTAAHKAAVRDSRVLPTRRLAELMGERTFVVASAVGYYGPGRGDEELTETSTRGGGFLAELVEAWEEAAEPARASGARVVHVRTGIVQTPSGGMLALQRPLFALGAGGRLGNGRQWVPWISLDDLLDVELRALVDARLAGPVNAVAPEPVTNAAYTTTLGRVLHRPTVARVPAVAPRLLLGAEGAREFALAGQRALPARLQALGHRFRHPELEPALRHLLGRT